MFGTIIYIVTLLVCCFTCRVQKEVVSLGVYKEDDWLQFGTWHDRYDSINTLVMYRAITGITITVGDHEVLIYLQHPVHSSQYYKQRSSHTV